MGKSVAASIAGATGNQKSIKQITYDTLLGLSEQAAGKAVWEGAEALASAALYDYDAAAKHGAAALAFGALAVTSGLGARAIGAPSASSSSRPTSGMATQSSGPQTLVGSGSSSSVTQQQNGPVTINLSVMPGGEPEAGRAVMRALQALQNQTGQSVQPLIASA
jgi:hypothetical protein